VFTLPIGVNLYQFYLSAAISLLSFVKTKRRKRGVWGLSSVKGGGMWVSSGVKGWVWGLHRRKRGVWGSPPV